MSNDRELLGLAAKAAGYGELRFLDDSSIIVNARRWNPLADDGDAMRLAIKLDISLRQQFAMVVAEYPCVDAEFNERNTLCEGVLDDHCASSRRAIVRAAAEIGKKVDAPHEAVLIERGYGLDAIGARPEVDPIRAFSETDHYYRNRLIARMRELDAQREAG